MKEENIMQYMAGHVVAKLKKRYPQFPDLFKSFQTGMQIDPDIVKDFHDFTRIWADQLD